MHKLIPVSVLIATAAVFYDAAIAAQLRLAPPQHHASTTDATGDTILLAGGMGGGTAGGMGTAGGGMTGGGMGGMAGGGMGGMTSGGMGGMTGGGMGGTTGGGIGNMPDGGMTGMTGRGIGGTTGYGTPNAGDPYGSSQTAADPSQSTRYYHCVTQHGQCSLSSSPGALRSGTSCTCLFGGKGTIK